MRLIANKSIIIEGKMSLFQEVSPFTCMTFNLCNTVQMDKDKAYEGLRFKDRLDKITAVIKTLSPDIIGLQEVRDYEGGTVMADLWERLKPLGYRIHGQEGNPHEFAVYNVIAYKTNKVWPKTITSWWNSDTPDESSCSYGNGWPRAVLGIEFCPVKQLTVHRQYQGTGKETSFNRPAPDNSLPSLFVINSHLGLGIGTSDPREKVLSNQTTLEKIKQFVGSKPMFVVSLGDFNSFPDGKFYEEEMNIYKENGFVDGVTSSPLQNQDGVRISGTFMGYSPDPFKCSEEKFGASLDHIWYRTFNKDDSWDINIKRCFVATLTGEPELDSRKIEKESDLLTGSDSSPLRNRYPSDHLPVILDFELRTNRPVDK